MYSIRHYNQSDFPLISQWWNEAKELAPTEEMMPVDSSFIVESEFGEPIAVVTVYTTNSKQFCMADNLVGNPTFYGQYRIDAINFLLDYASEWAAKKGFLSLLCMADKPSLVERYKEFGFYPTIEKVTTMIKPLQESV
jgi:hypothetical protein